MVHLRFKKKAQEETGTASHTEVDHLDRDGIQAQLQEVREEIDFYNTQLGKLLDAKVAGSLHDGAYNTLTTSVTMEVQKLEKREQALLALIDKINSDFARTAFKSQ